MLTMCHSLLMRWNSLPLGAHSSVRETCNPRSRNYSEYWLHLLHFQHSIYSVPTLSVSKMYLKSILFPPFLLPPLSPVLNVAADPYLSPQLLCCHPALIAKKTKVSWKCRSDHITHCSDFVFWLEDSCSTVLLVSAIEQRESISYTFACIPICGFLSHPGHRKALSRVSCAGQ